MFLLFSWLIRGLHHWYYLLGVRLGIKVALEYNYLEGSYGASWGVDSHSAS